MQLNISDSWKNILQTEFEKPYFKNLTSFVDNQYNNHTCFPYKEAVFAAFNYCSFDDLKVVIIGQDPYHGKGQANGLCFSVKDGIKHPPSLKNIFKEVETDVGIPSVVSGDLSRWATQGVLLLNATLTVREGEAGSHQQQGWEEFTDVVIRKISEEKENVVFLLWGKFAEKKGGVINLEKHTIFKAPHPSPLGAWRGWFGSGHFSKTNDFLRSKDYDEIKW
ncbi:uracil-DNA glycosylase [Tenacibaculum sp. AHE15PA]|uniref:uracil-DNA glycosylase n=1 Tax=unclassified Tenacibaculum TaxID=2635139 RepID=UPI001C4EEFF4|nr:MULTISPECIES: uracil-DNA glycosylase [unclassified Tenacibaculum]QXP74121.1 uracil-DNA glycosylase [Tenacibaculum sp. AHE14PA]QXP75511.1 uracil-DNA glycosylase [Tenacibaculum sp. AHE15PA]